jgi:hypothetical protein
MRIGQRIQMTPKAIEAGFASFKNSPRTGRLVSFTKAGLLRVLKDGTKNPVTYHPSFWEPKTGR